MFATPARVVRFIVVALLIVVAVLAFLARPDAKPHELTGKVVYIFDGDTLKILDGDQVQHRIRLYGIDAPEKGQAFGTKAQEALAEKVHKKTVRVVLKEMDQYGRIIGDVYLGDRNINLEMVLEGWAWWYRRYAPNSKPLEQAEAEARKARRGLWHDKNPELPFEYREQEHEGKKAGRKPSIK
jgi:endonuclease YncB( thermonuclease family)